MFNSKFFSQYKIDNIVNSNDEFNNFTIFNFPFAYQLYFYILIIFHILIILLEKMIMDFKNLNYILIIMIHIFTLSGAIIEIFFTVTETHSKIFFPFRNILIILLLYCWGAVMSLLSGIYLILHFYYNNFVGVLAGFFSLSIAIQLCIPQIIIIRFLFQKVFLFNFLKFT